MWGVGATNGVYPALKAGSPPAGVPDLAVNTMRHHNTIATVVAFFFFGLGDVCSILLQQIRKRNRFKSCIFMLCVEKWLEPQRSLDQL